MTSKTKSAPTLGAGDKVLIAIAGIVSKKLRSVDLLARFGGEEFLVICPGIGGTQATRLAERLRSEIAAAKIDTLPKITCSFGVCNFSGDEDCAQSADRRSALGLERRVGSRGERRYPATFLYDQMGLVSPARVLSARSRTP